MSLCNPCCPLGQDKEKGLVIWAVKHERNWVSESAVLPCEGFTLRTILVLGQIGRLADQYYNYFSKTIVTCLWDSRWG